MKTFKPTGAELEKLQQAASLIKEGNSTLASAKKQVDIAKTAIADWLDTSRDTVVETLLIGEILQIEGVCLITIDKQNRFDEKAFALTHPELYQQFKVDRPVIKYKPLV